MSAEEKLFIKLFSINYTLDLVSDENYNLNISDYENFTPKRHMFINPFQIYQTKQEYTLLMKTSHYELFRNVLHMRKLYTQSVG